MSETSFRIAFVDDRPEQQETIIRGIRGRLPKGWECIECPLLPEINQYAPWVLDNKILVLLVDQLLNERAANIASPVDYKGHDVVRSIREVLPEFPVFIVTRATEDPELLSHYGEADGIVDRTELLKDVEQYIARFSRQGRAFLNQFEGELAELTELSKVVAAGDGKTKDIRRLRAIQAKLGISTQDLMAPDEALSALEREVDKLGTLREKMEAFLEGRSRSPKEGAKKRRKKT